MLKWVSNILGDSNEKEIKRLRPQVDRINAIEAAFERLSDEALRAKTDEFKARLASGATLDDLLPEAFAAVREAAKRAIGQRHFDVQLMGGMVLHHGKIAEMKTGEGKTLVATLPAYLNALTGQGVHIVTVNDYLAKRDTQWMGPIYQRLGLQVGCIQHEAAFLFDPEFITDDPRMRYLRPIPRREAYQVDITHGTNNEFGFDYLRDNMVTDLEQCVQGQLHYAIVDEVDNILIDEARTPLIISGPAAESTEIYNTFARLVPRLVEEEDYVVDEKLRAVTLTESGISKIEKWLGVSNIYDPQNYHLTSYMEAALKANVLYRRDRDYVVKDGEVIIVDEFTGRLMFGRRYSEGLHQAIEAKEGVKIQRETMTLATITLQNYFRLYDKLAGMTGTALTQAEEFHKIYKLEVMVIPTHKPMIRTDTPDQIYKDEEAKFRAAVREIEELHTQGRPVLVGTVSIEKSEYLGDMLTRKGIPHQVLNAKHHEREASIIAQAGRLGMVTIATNMAGRGTDIILGGNAQGLAEDVLRRQGLNPATATPEQWEAAQRQVEPAWSAEHNKVVELGGLHIIGTERHEARRIDNQLRGRSGRQGDPGSSRFYVSLEDDLMRRFGGDRIKGIMEWAGLDDDTPIENSLVNRSIENAQTKVEGFNFDIRKHLVEYDDVMNRHRDVIYTERRKILSGTDLKSNIQGMIEAEIGALVSGYLEGRGEEANVDGFLSEVQAIMPLPPSFSLNDLTQMAAQDVKAALLEHARALYEERELELGPETMRMAERLVMLRIIDTLWLEHLTTMEEIREGIGLRAIGQVDPLVVYKKEAHETFQSLLDSIRRGIVRTIFHVSVTREPAPAPSPAMASARAHRGDGAGGGGRGAEPVRAGRKVGRNDPCPCGSGKKYKKCHGA